MKESIRQRLEKMSDRFEEVGPPAHQRRSCPATPRNFATCPWNMRALQPLAERMRGYHGLERDLASAQEMLADPDRQHALAGCRGTYAG